MMQGVFLSRKVMCSPRIKSLEEGVIYCLISPLMNPGCYPNGYIGTVDDLAEDICSTVAVTQKAIARLEKEGIVYYGKTESGRTTICVRLLD